MVHSAIDPHNPATNQAQWKHLRLTIAYFCNYFTLQLCKEPTTIPDEMAQSNFRIS